MVTATWTLNGQPASAALCGNERRFVSLGLTEVTGRWTYHMDILCSTGQAVFPAPNQGCYELTGYLNEFGDPNPLPAMLIAGPSVAAVRVGTAPATAALDFTLP